MLIDSMSRMMEFLAPYSVHVLSPKAPRSAEGLANQVYAQMRRDFMVAGPFVLHSEVPELLAASWSLVRETLFTGDVDRGSKEVIAWAVSQANSCPFCIDAHLAAVKANNSEDPALVAWAKSSTSANNAATTPRPFFSNHAEHLGTLTAFHYLNRMVSVFLDEKMMPMPNAMNGVSHSMARFMMGGLIKKGMQNKPGDSIDLLPQVDSSFAWKPEWAQGTPHIAAALVGWSSIIESAAAERIDGELIQTLGTEIDHWRGDTIESIENEFKHAIDSTDKKHVPALKLALLTVVSPYKITDKLVIDAISGGRDNKDILVLVAWAAQRAARQCAEWSYTSPANQ